MTSVFIVSAVRTPIGKFGGAFTGTSAVELRVVAAREAVQRAAIEPESIGETIMGLARQAGNGPNPARQISIRSGVPEGTPAYTVNKACGSGLKALILGANEIMLGNQGAVLVGGSENMSRVPYFAEGVRWGARLGHQPLVDGMYRDGFHCPLADMVMGETAERLAEIHKISRDEQDTFAVRSQNRASDAVRTGRFRDEVVAVPLAGKKGEVRMFDTEEHIRMDVSLADMQKLPPVFSKSGTITAGNSSGITDGASALVLVSEAELRRRGLTPLARIVGHASAGVDPKVMGIGPVPAIRKLLSVTGLALADFGLIELNEAFAAQVLACQRELPIDPDRLNVNGGAIALGHPIGCTGARIVTTLLHEMKRRQVRYGMATLCISGGMGLAVAFERA